MNKLLHKYSVIVPFVLLPVLILIIPFSSCSRPNLGDIVRAHIQAVNADDVDKNLTFFADDIVFEMDSYAKISGKDQLRGLMESDVVNKARLTIDDINVERDIVIVKLRENNEIFKLLGIEDSAFAAIFKFRGRLIEKVELESPSASAKLWDEKYKPFAEWANREHPEEFKRTETGGYSAENCRRFLSLLKEWRDKTQTQSVEQELIKLEKGWIDALVRHDWAFIDRILADDYTTTDSEGVILNKDQEMAVIESGEEAITSAAADDFRVRVYGDAAVVTFRWTYKGQVRGKETTGQERYTDTWIRRGGQWQCLAIHASRIAQK